MEKKKDNFIAVMSFSISSKTKNFSDFVSKTLYATTPLLRPSGSLFVPKWKEPDLCKQINLSRRTVETEKTEGNDS